MRKNEEKVIYNLICSVIKKKRAELHEPNFNNLESKYLKKAIKRKFVSRKGNFVDGFLKKIKLLTKSNYVILTSSGTSALHLALLAINLKENEEVLMPSLNYIASANATLYCSAIPHFVDVDEESLGIDPRKLDNYLSKICKLKKKQCYNKKTNRLIKALICLHTFGYPAKILEIKKICAKYNIKLIEDSAEALGSFLNKKHLGTFGDIGILSFNGNKIITTGSGGAVLTNNLRLAKKIDHLSKIAKKAHPYKLDYNTLGYNYNMSNLNAALGLAQIEKINFFLNKKKKLHTRYSKKFQKIKFLKVFSDNKLNKSNNWLITLILDKSNKALLKKLFDYSNSKKISTRPVFKLLHKINYLKKYPKMNLENSIELEGRIITIPSSSFL
tara:strand:+ start:5168 stop:6325 length:1158 start_codon:yes stop_codon:yes gene_type:complete